MVLRPIQEPGEADAAGNSQLRGLSRQAVSKVVALAKNNQASIGAPARDVRERRDGETLTLEEVQTTARDDQRA